MPGGRAVWHASGTTGRSGAASRDATGRQRAGIRSKRTDVTGGQRRKGRGRSVGVSLCRPPSYRPSADRDGVSPTTNTSSTPIPTPWLRPREAAAYLRTTDRQLRRWAISRGLPVHHVGGLTLYSASELDAWVAEHVDPPQPSRQRRSASTGRTQRRANR